MTDIARYHLKTTLNQCFCDFGKREFTYAELLVMTRGNDVVLNQSLAEWESKGFLSILMGGRDENSEQHYVTIISPIEWS